LIRVVYLYGSAAHCIDAFLKRERSSGRNLGLDHWLLNNIEKYMQMSKPEFEPYRTHVFTVRGGRRSHAAVLGDIQKNRKAKTNRVNGISGIPAAFLLSVLHDRPGNDDILIKVWTIKSRSSERYAIIGPQMQCS